MQATVCTHCKYTYSYTHHKLIIVCFFEECLPCAESTKWNSKLNVNSPVRNLCTFYSDDLEEEILLQAYDYPGPTEAPSFVDYDVPSTIAILPQADPNTASSNGGKENLAMMHNSAVDNPLLHSREPMCDVVVQQQHAGREDAPPHRWLSWP